MLEGRPEAIADPTAVLPVGIAKPCIEKILFGGDREQKVGGGQQRQRAGEDDALQEERPREDEQDRSEIQGMPADRKSVV